MDRDFADALTQRAGLFAEAHLRMDRRMEATLGVYRHALDRALQRPYLPSKRVWD